MTAPRSTKNSLQTRTSSARLVRLRAALRRRAVASLGLALTTLAIVPFGSAEQLQNDLVSGRAVERVSQGRFICWPRDDAAVATYRLAGLRRVPPGRPAVYLLGGSAMRECFVSASSLHEQILIRCGSDVRVVPLASSEQHLAGSLALVDALPTGGGGVIVIGLHHTPFAYGIRGALDQLHGDQLMVRSAALREFLEGRLDKSLTSDIRPGIYAHVAQYEWRRDAGAFTAPAIAYDAHRYPMSMATSDAFKRSRVTEWLQGRGRPGGPFFDNFGLNAALLEELVTTARAKGFEVLIMESPLNAAFIGDAFDPYKAKYRAVCTALRDEHGAHYVNLNRVVGLHRDDFRDLLHLLPPGYHKWQPRLADSLAQILSDHPPVEPSPGPTPAPSGPVTTEDR